MKTTIEKKYHCDRCKKQIEETPAMLPDGMIASVIFIDNDYKIPMWKKIIYTESKLQKKLLLCRKCFDEFRHFLNHG